MHDRKWRPVGEPVNAGDVFGDNQVGMAFVVTYLLDAEDPKPHTPHASGTRVSAYFGVERVPQPDHSNRYSPVSRITLEILDEDGDMVDGVDFDNGDVFPFDYVTLTQARQDVHKVMQQWQRTTWAMNDFFDGKELPRG